MCIAYDFKSYIYFFFPSTCVNVIEFFPLPCLIPGLSLETGGGRGPSPGTGTIKRLDLSRDQGGTMLSISYCWPQIKQRTKLLCNY